jgi:hypothetical protein
MINPSDRIKVIESNKKCKPGSVGYFVNLCPVHNYNGWQAAAVFTRLGKAGKPRIELVPFAMPIVDLSTLKKPDKDIINIIKYAEMIEPRTDPSDIGRKRRRHTIETGGTKIKRIDHLSKNLLLLNPIEFLAYVAASSLFLHSVLHAKNSLNLNRPYGVRIHRFVEEGFPIQNINPEVIGFYILEGWKYDQRNKSSVCSTFFTGYVAKMLTRMDICDKLSLSKAHMSQAIEKYRNGKIEFYALQQSEKISKMLKYYKKYKKELKEIEKAEAELPAWRMYRSPRLEKEIQGAYKAVPKVHYGYKDAADYT